MKESSGGNGGQNDSAGLEGSDGNARLADGDLASRGRPISLAVSADQVRQHRKIGVPSLGSNSSNNNNNNKSHLSLSDLSDMSSESDSEFPPPPPARSHGDSEGKRFPFTKLTTTKVVTSQRSWSSLVEGDE